MREDLQIRKLETPTHCIHFCEPLLQSPGYGTTSHIQFTGLWAWIIVQTNRKLVLKSESIPKCHSVTCVRPGVHIGTSSEKLMMQNVATLCCKSFLGFRLICFGISISLGFMPTYWCFHGLFETTQLAVLMFHDALIKLWFVRCLIVSTVILYNANLFFIYTCCDILYCRHMSWHISILSSLRSSKQHCNGLQ